MRNLGYVQDKSINTPNENPPDFIQAQINETNASNDVTVPPTSWHSRLQKLWSNYRWRMRHYFYVHLTVFFFNALLCGFIVWNIEGYEIPYIDCWFISASSVFTCGLHTYDFSVFSQASQMILLIFTLVSGKILMGVQRFILKQKIIFL